eukprot:6108665-Prorocentrum_lima.AAC.1
MERPRVGEDRDPRERATTKRKENPTTASAYCDQESQIHRTIMNRKKQKNLKNQKSTRTHKNNM